MRVGMGREKRGGKGVGGSAQGCSRVERGREGGRKLELGSMRREVLISIEQ